jgi:hypothetical protein
MTRPTVTQNAQAAKTQPTPKQVRNRDLIAHRFDAWRTGTGGPYVRAAQFVGTGRAASLPGLSPAMAVLVRLLGELPTSLLLAGIGILAAALVLVIASLLRAQPPIAADHRFNGRHDRRRDDHHPKTACGGGVTGLAPGCGRRSALLTAAP